MTTFTQWFCRCCGLKRQRQLNWCFKFLLLTSFPLVHASRICFASIVGYCYFAAWKRVSSIKIKYARAHIQLITPFDLFYDHHAMLFYFAVVTNGVFFIIVSVFLSITGIIHLPIFTTASLCLRLCCSQYSLRIFVPVKPQTHQCGLS